MSALLSRIKSFMVSMNFQKENFCGLFLVCFFLICMAYSLNGMRFIIYRFLHLNGNVIVLIKESIFVRDQVLMQLHPDLAQRSDEFS